MKISFDFDDTLSNISVQRLAHIAIKAGHDVHIVTSRMSNERAGNPGWNDDLYIVAKCVGIPDENIHFCNLTPKHEFFKKNEDFSLHLDDDSDDVDGINLHCKKTEAVLFVDTFTNSILSEFSEKLME